MQLLNPWLVKQKGISIIVCEADGAFHSVFPRAPIALRKVKRSPEPFTIVNGFLNPSFESLVIVIRREAYVIKSMGIEIFSYFLPNGLYHIAMKQ